MIYLPDVNLWLAFASTRHMHHAAAKAWFNSQQASGICFCRITELGLLRLLTNRHVMEGDALSAQDAWQIYGRFRQDGRVFFVEEGPLFDGSWGRAMPQIDNHANAWTDAYLAVFAHHIDATIVTFDRGFKPVNDCHILTLNVAVA